MASGPSEKGRTIRLSTELFLHIELVVYVALGILLSVTALLSLGSQRCFCCKKCVTGAAPARYSLSSIG
jgi:hypothetical protein